MRKTRIIPGEYYHIYNRGNNKQDIFFEERDWIRFLFLILYFQSPINFPQISRFIFSYVKNRVFDNIGVITREVVKNREVELVSFTFMPNHFHLIVHEIKEGGISKYMERVQKAYTKYFNAKYEKSGHLFQGPFQVVHIKNNEQLLHLSAYIYRNPREIKEWQNKEEHYPCSSYQDCIIKNRWGDLLINKIILNQFSKPKEYKNFVETSGTKLLEEENLLLE